MAAVTVVVGILGVTLGGLVSWAVTAWYAEAPTLPAHCTNLTLQPVEGAGVRRWCHYETATGGEYRYRLDQLQRSTEERLEGRPETIHVASSVVTGEGA